MNTRAIITLTLLLFIGCNTTSDSSDDTGSDADIAQNDAMSQTEQEHGDDADSERIDEDIDSDTSSDGDPADNDNPDTDVDPGFNEVEETVTCDDSLTIDGANLCETSGSGDALLLKGDVLAYDREYIGGDVLVDANGTIVCHGCNCDTHPAADNAVVITCPDGVISPALINAHDHMGWTHNDPGDWGDERFDHRHDWRKGLHGHTKISAPGGASTENKQWGELRNVMAGTTTIAGSGGADGFLRNIDRSQYLEGLGKGDVEYNTFPLGDNDGTQLDGSCKYDDYQDGKNVLDHGCYLPHVAEGIDKYARNEFLCLSSDTYADGSVDLTESNATFIHGVGLNAEDGEELAENNTAIIWSPRTNVSLYGNTAPVTMFHRQGVLLGLGTDWTPSGSINMLRELACARYLNKNHYGNYFTDRDLWLMATLHNAAALHASEVIGAVQDGLTADIAVFDGRDRKTPYSAVINADVSRVALVLRGGVVLYGDDNIVPALPDSDDCETITVCTVEKQVCVKRETGKTFNELKADNSSAYDLFFCGVPDGEPTCIPLRTLSDETQDYNGVPTVTDQDGDGVEDAADNCPDIFNPVRPLDNGKQGNADNDGTGDLCDPCPLLKNTEDCSVPNRNDRDADGIRNFEDNCPFDSNPQQEDDDNDGIGDVCDTCAHISNPGFSACPATIYDMKQGVIRPGAAVTGVTGVVTAVADDGFYLQVREDSDAWDNTLKHRFSGIYVYANDIDAQLGDHVGFDATLDMYYDLLELTNVTDYTILDESGDALPKPKSVTPEEIRTDGDYADDYNCVLVSVRQVEVIDDSLGYNEFLVTGDLRIDDTIYSYTAPPAEGTRFDRITGILGFSFDNSKLWPRDADDMEQ